MKLSGYLKESLSNLLSAKLRSFLAILGILVGTASVVALIGSGQMATDHALAQFKTLGTNLLSLSIDQNSSHGNGSSEPKYFTMSDVPIAQSADPAVELVAPYINVYSSIHYHAKELQGQIFAANQALFDIVKLHIQQGRFISYLDAHSRYCDIGSKLAEQLKSRGVFNPVGKQIKLGAFIYTIVGVLKPWQPNLFLYADLNSSALVPINKAYQLSRYAHIDSILFRIKKGVPLKPVQDAIKAKLSLLLPKARLMFRSPEQIIGIMSKQRKTFTLLLTMIGSISLLVGGIGVMNIMLVSVIERRREIGIRMALGARQRDIRRMFLVESISLTLFGGLLGVGIGVGISAVLAEFSHWEFTFYLLPPALGFAVSVLVGIVSGFYPAYRASQLDPIETLQGGD